MSTQHAPAKSEMTEEDYLYEQLRMLQLSYEKAAKPIVDRLVRINSLRCHPSIRVSMSELEAFNPEMADQARAAISKATEES
jgi:hypothetical protein